MASRPIDDVRAEALFVADLQRSDCPNANQIRRAVGQALRRHGSRTCAALVAAEFGDHPEAAVDRMRWALDAIGQAYPPARELQVTGRA